MIELTDAEAIARSLTEPRAFEVVFHRHFAVIHRYLTRRVGEELAQELAAETSRSRSRDATASTADRPTAGPGWVTRR